jgi:hypothetical protein
MRHDRVHAATAIVNLFDHREQEVIAELAEQLDLSPQTVVRQALRLYQQFLQPVNLPSKKLYDDSEPVLARLTLLAEDGYATDTQRATARAALQEIERLREGDFTEPEFQNLCHCISEEDRERFFAGCAEFQRKLFGTSDRDELLIELESLRESLSGK